MELVYTLVVAVVVFYFGSTLKKLAESTDNVIGTGAKVIDTITDVADDTTATYGFDLKLDNAEHRNELSARAQAMGPVVTLDELDALLKGKATKAAA